METNQNRSDCIRQQFIETQLLTVLRHGLLMTALV